MGKPAGSIGYGVVTGMGKSVRGFAANDTVLVVSSGTWASTGSFPATSVKKVPTIAVR